MSDKIEIRDGTDLLSAYLAGNYCMSSMCRILNAEIETLREALKDSDGALQSNIATFLDLRQQSDTAWQLLSGAEHYVRAVSDFNPEAAQLLDRIESLELTPGQSPQ